MTEHVGLQIQLRSTGLQPGDAKHVFPVEAVPELEEIIRNPTPALPAVAEPPRSSEAQQKEDTMDC